MTLGNKPNMPKMKHTKRDGASLLVDCLEAHGVKYIFGVPGASLLPILDILHDRGPEFVVCRHEQNAAFMAQAWGRLTGQPGVCMATVGPGATNLVTGVATATADRDPVVALTGQTPRAHRFQNRHQNIDAAALFAPITKWSVELEDAAAIPEAIAQAFRTAATPRAGATHLAFPTDILTGSATGKPLARLPTIKESEEVYDEKLADVADLIRRAKRPVVFLGVGAADQRTTDAVRAFLKKTGIPAVGTFEAAGVVGRELVGQFLGRVGLAAEEPGDVALREADLVITIGYDVVEYAPALWPTVAKIVHIDRLSPSVDAQYAPIAELVGDIVAIVKRLQSHIKHSHWSLTKQERAARQILLGEQARGLARGGIKIHPARLVAEIRKALSDTDIVISDVGAHQIWLAREYFTYEPKTLLFSMGFQTMGVALPWAMAARLAEPKKRIVSCSGDGSFLMSAMELETAVRRKLNFVHLVWRDGSYNLVEIQQMMSYGRTSGTKFSNPDIVKYAEAFGATGLRAETPDTIASTLERAFKIKGPVIIDVPVDYSHNVGLLGKGGLFD
jgi:acetolactate synthase-1/2/3 large subunit